MGKMWKLSQEKKELENRQKSLRAKQDELLAMKDEYTKALIKANLDGDDEKVARLKGAIAAIDGDLSSFEAASRTDMEKIDKTTHAALQSNTAKCNVAGQLLTAGGIGLSTGLAMYGMSKAYDADVQGSLVNKGLLGFVKGMNPFTLLKRH